MAGLMSSNISVASASRVLSGSSYDKSTCCICMRKSYPLPSDPKAPVFPFFSLVDCRHYVCQPCALVTCDNAGRFIRCPTCHSVSRLAQTGKKRLNGDDGAPRVAIDDGVSSVGSLATTRASTQATGRNKAAPSALARGDRRKRRSSSVQFLPDMVSSVVEDASVGGHSAAGTEQGGGNSPLTREAVGKIPVAPPKLPGLVSAQIESGDARSKQVSEERQQQSVSLYTLNAPSSRPKRRAKSEPTPATSRKYLDGPQLPLSRPPPLKIQTVEDDEADIARGRDSSAKRKPRRSEVALRDIVAAEVEENLAACVVLEREERATIEEAESYQWRTVEATASDDFSLCLGRGMQRNLIEAGLRTPATPPNSSAAGGSQNPGLPPTGDTRSAGRKSLNSDFGEDQVSATSEDDDTIATIMSRPTAGKLAEKREACKRQLSQLKRDPDASEAAISTLQQAILTLLSEEKKLLVEVRSHLQPELKGRSSGDTEERTGNSANSPAVHELSLSPSTTTALLRVREKLKDVREDEMKFTKAQLRLLRGNQEALAANAAVMQALYGRLAEARAEHMTEMTEDLQGLRDDDLVANMDSMKLLEVKLATLRDDAAKYIKEEMELLRQLANLQESQPGMDEAAEAYPQPDVKLSELEGKLGDVRAERRTAKYIEKLEDNLRRLRKGIHKRGAKEAVQSIEEQLHDLYRGAMEAPNARSSSARSVGDRSVGAVSDSERTDMDFSIGMSRLGEAALPENLVDKEQQLQPAQVDVPPSGEEKSLATQVEPEELPCIEEGEAPKAVEVPLRAIETEPPTGPEESIVNSEVQWSHEPVSGSECVSLGFHDSGGSLVDHSQAGILDQILTLVSEEEVIRSMWDLSESSERESLCIERRSASASLADMVLRRAHSSANRQRHLEERERDDVLEEEEDAWAALLRAHVERKRSIEMDSEVRRQGEAFARAQREGEMTRRAAREQLAVEAQEADTRLELELAEEKERIAYTRIIKKKVASILLAAEEETQRGQVEEASRDASRRQVLGSMLAAQEIEESRERIRLERIAAGQLGDAYRMCHEEAVSIISKQAKEYQYELQNAARTVELQRFYAQQLAHLLSREAEGRIDTEHSESSERSLLQRAFVQELLMGKMHEEMQRNAEELARQIRERSQEMELRVMEQQQRIAVPRGTVADFDVSAAAVSDSGFSAATEAFRVAFLGMFEEEDSQRLEQEARERLGRLSITRRFQLDQERIATEDVARTVEKVRRSAAITARRAFEQAVADTIVDEEEKRLGIESSAQQAWGRLKRDIAERLTELESSLDERKASLEHQKRRMDAQQRAQSMLLALNDKEYSGRAGVECEEHEAHLNLRRLLLRGEQRLAVELARHEALRVMQANMEHAAAKAASSALAVADEETGKRISIVSSERSERLLLVLAQQEGYMAVTSLVAEHKAVQAARLFEVQRRQQQHAAEWEAVISSEIHQRGGITSAELEVRLSLAREEQALREVILLAEHEVMLRRSEDMARHFAKTESRVHDDEGDDRSRLEELELRAFRDLVRREQQEATQVLYLMEKKRLDAAVLLMSRDHESASVRLRTRAVQEEEVVRLEIEDNEQSAHTELRRLYRMGRLALTTLEAERKVQREMEEMLRRSAEASIDHAKQHLQMQDAAPAELQQKQPEEPLATLRAAAAPPLLKAPVWVNEMLAAEQQQCLRAGEAADEELDPSESDIAEPYRVAMEGLAAASSVDRDVTQRVTEERLAAEEERLARLRAEHSQAEVRAQVAKLAAAEEVERVRSVTAAESAKLVSEMRRCIADIESQYAARESLTKEQRAEDQQRSERLLSALETRAAEHIAESQREVGRLVTEAEQRMRLEAAKRDAHDSQLQEAQQTLLQLQREAAEAALSAASEVMRAASELTSRQPSRSSTPQPEHLHQAASSTPPHSATTTPSMAHDGQSTGPSQTVSAAGSRFGVMTPPHSATDFPAPWGTGLRLSPPARVAPPTEHQPMPSSTPVASPTLSPNSRGAEVWDWRTLDETVQRAVSEAVHVMREQLREERELALHSQQKHLNESTSTVSMEHIHRTLQTPPALARADARMRMAPEFSAPILDVPQEHSHRALGPASMRPDCHMCMQPSLSTCPMCSSLVCIHCGPLGFGPSTLSYRMGLELCPVTPQQDSHRLCCYAHRRALLMDAAFLRRDPSQVSLRQPPPPVVFGRTGEETDHPPSRSTAAGVCYDKRAPPGNSGPHQSAHTVEQQPDLAPRWPANNDGGTASTSSSPIQVLSTPPQYRTIGTSPMSGGGIGGQDRVTRAEVPTLSGREHAPAEAAVVRKLVDMDESADGSAQSKGTPRDSLGKRSGTGKSASNRGEEPKTERKPFRYAPFFVPLYDDPVAVAPKCEKPPTPENYVRLPRRVRTTRASREKSYREVPQAHRDIASVRPPRQRPSQGLPQRRAVSEEHRKLSRPLAPRASSADVPRWEARGLGPSVPRQGRNHAAGPPRAGSPARVAAESGCQASERREAQSDVPTNRASEWRRRASMEAARHGVGPRWTTASGPLRHTDPYGISTQGLADPLRQRSYQQHTGSSAKEDVFSTGMASPLPPSDPPMQQASIVVDDEDDIAYGVAESVAWCGRKGGMTPVERTADSSRYARDSASAVLSASREQLYTPAYSALWQREHQNEPARRQERGDQTAMEGRERRGRYRDQRLTAEPGERSGWQKNGVDDLTEEWPRGHPTERRTLSPTLADLDKRLYYLQQHRERVAREQSHMAAARREWTPSTSARGYHSPCRCACSHPDLPQGPHKEMERSRSPEVVLAPHAYTKRHAEQPRYAVHLPFTNAAMVAQERGRQPSQPTRNPQVAAASQPRCQLSRSRSQSPANVRSHVQHFRPHPPWRTDYNSSAQVERPPWNFSRPRTILSEGKRPPR